MFSQEKKLHASFPNNNVFRPRYFKSCISASLGISWTHMQIASASLTNVFLFARTTGLTSLRFLYRYSILGILESYFVIFLML